MIISQRDSRWWFRLNGVSRHVLLNGAMPWCFYPLVNEFPKSGGSWFAQMLAQALNIPNPRNRLPMLRSSMMHGHYLRPLGMKNVVIVWRDGRDVMVSHYHHLVSQNEFASKSAQSHTRKSIQTDDPGNIHANLARFIELSAEGKIHPWFSWSQFYRAWHNQTSVAAELRYETLLTDSSSELFRVQEILGGLKSKEECISIAEQFSFQRQANRKPGEENNKSFLRKGIAGDWKNVFGREAAEVFQHYHGDALIELGYETNSDWVDRVTSIE